MSFNLVQTTCPWACISTFTFWGIKGIRIVLKNLTGFLWKSFNNASSSSSRTSVRAKITSSLSRAFRRPPTPRGCKTPPPGCPGKKRPLSSLSKTGMVSFGVSSVMDQTILAFTQKGKTNPLGAYAEAPNPTVRLTEEGEGRAPAYPIRRGDRRGSRTPLFGTTEAMTTPVETPFPSGVLRSVQRSVKCFTKSAGQNLQNYNYALLHALP